MAAVQQGTKDQLERADGAARLVYGRRQGATRLADLYQRAPCRVLFPDVEKDDAFTTALLTTSGGLTGGDRIKIEVVAGEGSVATVTTQAAEKIYRSIGAPCAIEVSIDVGADAWVEWLMQETILFDGAMLRRRTNANMASTGRLLAVESLVFGRSAMGEAFQRGYVRDQWRIRRDGRLIWTDALKLESDIAAEKAMPFGLGNAAGCATLVYCGQDAARWLGAARGAIEQVGVKGGATSFDGLLVAKLWADDASVLRRAVAHCIACLRSEIAGLPARLPRLWSI